MTIPEITSETEEGFHDLVFALTEYDTMSNGAQRLLCAGLADGREVKFLVELGSVGTGSGAAMDSGIVRLLSAGQASDDFLSTLARLYEVSDAHLIMTEVTMFTALALEGDPSQLADGPVKLKLFHESDDEDLYAEFYLNIDAAASRVELREKDSDYREPMILVLAGAVSDA